ncbi:stalk domain-containing protein [Paenibacillus sabinae]|uniref:Copper amine oxidase-like N-terminal domain-containing protein n=1 Tax=Paenibacillus sabinae T27 TaxID=1268072 RepID=X4ZN08_9BACL|nr:hypothetical protein [Paenibacillus sabinae]AHV98617.1 hypothetical protein PSAB_18615 [Paenibacillus sabinae T27]
MKRNQLLGVLMASALLVSAGEASVYAAAGPVSKPSSVKASVKATVKVKEGVKAWTVNGAQTTFKTVDAGGYKLYSISQLAASLGASIANESGSLVLKDKAGVHTIKLKAGSKSYTLDSVKHNFTTAPTVFGGKLYVELSAIVNGLGGELFGSPLQILGTARLQGEFDTIHWAADGTVLANLESETTQIYKFGANPGSFGLFSSDDKASDFAVSGDRRYGAFTDETGLLYVIDLTSGAVKPVGTDTSTKTDLTWSTDGKIIYFIQGDKQEKISQISVDTGAVTELLADKVENKSELHISADGKRAVYIVNITGTAKNDADSTEDSLTVDFSKAGEQLYQLDLSTKDAKPAALTTSDDNKLYPEIQADGTVVYLSADPEGKTVNTLKTVKPDGTTANIALDIEVNWAEAAAGGIIASGTAADGTSRIYSVTVSGSSQELFRTKADISEVAVSADGSKLAVIVGGKLVTIENGKSVQLTR